MTLARLKHPRTFLIITLLWVYALIACLPIVWCRETDGSEHAESTLAPLCHFRTSELATEPGLAWLSIECRCVDSRSATVHISEQEQGATTIAAPAKSPLDLASLPLPCNPAIHFVPASAAARLLTSPPPNHAMTACRIIVQNC